MRFFKLGRAELVRLKETIVELKWKKALERNPLLGTNIELENSYALSYEL